MKKTTHLNPGNLFRLHTVEEVRDDPPHEVSPRIWQMRQDIRNFVRLCAADYPLAGPFLDAACGYRTNFRELVEGIARPIEFAAFDAHDYREENPWDIHQEFVADVQNIPLPDNCAGVVVCTETIEHVPDHMQVLRELIRVLKPGGHLIITAPGVGVPYHPRGGYQKDWGKRFSSEPLPDGGIDETFSEEKFTVFSLPIVLEKSRIQTIQVQTHFGMLGEVTHVMAIGTKKN